ncbi:hypothetical protein L4C36_21325 [Photobacterium japonica]|uniref:hypothetical protein n=1 Tax=Photobacterium japonica TaxID=2910235 RepID=UPI003D0E8A2B
MKKARCPSCHAELADIPLSRLCPHCLTFHLNWKVYDWQGYIQLARWAIRANAVLLALCAFNGFIIFRSGAENLFQTALCLFAVPAVIGIVVNYRRIHCPEHYHGHRLSDLFSWRTQPIDSKQ